MLRILFYIPPFLMNIITGLIFFVPARRLAAANESAVAVAAAMSAWAVTYTITSISLGFIQNKKMRSNSFFSGRVFPLSPLPDSLL